MIDMTHVAIGDAPVGATPATFFPSADVLARLDDLAAAAADLQLPDVSFGGAEPFAHPELPALVTGAAERGAARIRLETDAAGLAAGGNAQGAIAAGVRHLLVTIRGEEAAHDAALGRPGAFAATTTGLRAWNAAAAAAGAHVLTWARIPVAGIQGPCLPAAVSAAAALGAGVVVLDSIADGPDAAALAPWLSAACETGTVNGVWVSAEGVPYCLLPGLELHVAGATMPRPELAKSPVCTGCALDALCCGVAVDEGVVLAALRPPERAAELETRISFARTGATR